MTKKLLRIISTNWIHILGFYITIYLSGILSKAVGLETDDGWKSILFTSLFTTLLAILIYGLPILGGFVLAVVTMDLAGFSWKNNWTKAILIVEWILVSGPFIYWAFKYEYWIWITLSTSFFITQMLRKKEIERLRLT